MTYWIYCTDCKQWNKSATSLSDGMTCSFCNNLLAKNKPYTLTNDAVTEIEEAQNSNTIPEIIETPKEDDNSSPEVAPIASETTEIPEVPEVSEVPEMMEIAEEQESSEITESEISEEEEISAANEIEDNSEATVEEVSEETEIVESPETAEEQTTPIVKETTPTSNRIKAPLTRTHKKSHRRPGRLR